MTRGLPLFVALLLGGSFPALAASVFTTRPDDPARGLPHGAGLRRARRRHERRQRGDPGGDRQGGRAGNGGIVFVPSGRYRLTRTIYVWRGVRVIGYGATRPVFVLARRHARLPEGHRR